MGATHHRPGRNEPVHIAIDASRAFKHPRTGTERYAWEILRGLMALPAINQDELGQDEWRLFTDRPPDPADVDMLHQLAPRGGSQIVVEVLPWRRMWTHRVLGPALRRAQVDVCFVPSHVIPFVWPPARNPPTVVTIHDLGYRRWPQAHPLFQRLYLQASTRWNLLAATHAITVSQATAQDIMTLYGAPRAPLHVIHEAAHTQPLPDREAIDAARAEFALPTDYAIFTGTLHPRKNIARVIAAYARLHARGDAGWSLVLAGAEGWQSQAFRAQVSRLGLEQQVRFLGYVPEAQRPALVAGARFFVFPSLFEGFGLPILEAQSLGVPVMTSNYSSLPEVAGDAALYVDPTDIDAIADAMLRLSQDDALRQRLVAAGYENVKRFSWEKAADETYAVLRAAAGRD